MRQGDLIVEHASQWLWRGVRGITAAVWVLMFMQAIEPANV